MSQTGATPRGSDRTCRQCGSRLGIGRFCLNCGAPVAVAGSAHESGLAGRLRRALHSVGHQRTPIVVFALFGGLAAIGGVGAQMLTAEVSDPSRPVVCWHGGEAASASDCAAPTGAEGLAWVFPGFRPDARSCRDSLLDNPESSRPTVWECRRRVDGHRVAVTYLEVADVASAQRYFDRRFSGRRREEIATGDGEPARYLWHRSRGARPELTTMYVDHPYAVSIRAPSAGLLTAALRTIEFRHPDRISVAGAPD